MPHKLLAASLTVILSGCSFLFTSSPPERVTAYTSIDCTTSRAAPAVDTVLSALSAVGTIYEANAEYPTEYIVAGAAWTLLWSASGIYGFTVVRACGEAKQQRDLLAEQLDQQRHGQPPRSLPTHQPTPPAAPVQWRDPVNGMY